MDSFFNAIEEIKRMHERGEETWKLEHELHDKVYEYADARFECGYEMGMRHGKHGTVKPIVPEDIAAEVEAAKERGRLMQ